MNVEKLKNGKFKYREKYKDPMTCKWRSVSVTYEKNNRHIEKLAQKELNKKIDNRLKKITSPNHEYTVREVGNIYLESMKGVLKYDSTYPKRVDTINRIVGLLGEDVLINNLTPVYLDEKLSNDHLKTMSKIFFNWAYHKALVNKNLSDFIVKTKKEMIYEDYKKKEIEKEYYERDELYDLFNKLSSIESYTFQMVRLIFEMEVLTSKRWSECTAIYEDDLDSDLLLLNIDKRAYLNSINLPKSEKSIGIIGINKRAAQIKKEAILLKRMYGVESKFLFAGPKGKPFSYSTARSCLRKIGYSSKTHIFRKTSASLLAENDVPLSYIQERLGHESNKTTERIYIQVTKKKERQRQEFFKKQNIL